MSKKLGTIWELEVHTAKKHEILRRYFEAWLPIMSRQNSRVVFIDGFAGPGRYKNGEDGSPVIVLRAACEHTFNFRCELCFIFVEEDRNRHEHLETTLKREFPNLSSKITFEVIRGTFDEHLRNTFETIKGQTQNASPTFVFVDPFGFAKTPFETIQAILKNPKCEVLVNFMYEEVNRFLCLGAHAAKYDKLFGTPDWRSVIDISSPETRRQRIHDIYLRQLKTAANYVKSFEMRNATNSTDYFLYFASNNLKGLEKMKEAMWKVDGTGSFLFSDHQHALGQPSLFDNQPNMQPLRDAIKKIFQGKKVLIEKLEEWVIAETDFLRVHLRKPVLAPMESNGELKVVNPKAGRRKGDFPAGTIIEFC